ncbi:MAG: hypothetical protein HY471_00330 [Candidatus Sungbacteria bacterium]|nr:hypothetical protein [Candidatus Sungbacteria bacterium]
MATRDMRHATWKKENHGGRGLVSCLLSLVARRGFAALGAVLIITVAGTLMIAALAFVSFREARLLRAFSASQKGYRSAEAAVEDAVYRYVSGKQIVSGEALASGTATATVTITGTSFEKTIVAEAVEGNAYYRTIESRIAIQGTPSGFSYGIQSGAGGFELGQNSTINGNVFSNGSIEGEGATKSTITGTAQAAGTSTIEDIRVDMAAYAGSFHDCSIGGGAYYVSSITSCPAASTTVLLRGIAPLNFPITQSNIDGWKAEALAGGELSSYSLGNSQTGALGPRKINGNVSLGNGAKLTLNGTVWVTGTIQFGNGSVIKLASGYGGNSGVLLVDGAVNFGNGAGLQGSGQSSSYLMLVDTFGPGTAIDVSNNATSSVLYAPNGIIDIKNNLELREATAWRIKIGGNATVNYDQGLLNVNFISGPAANWIVKSWRETE